VSNELDKPAQTGMTKEQEAELLKDDRPAFITVLHGVSEAAMKGIDGARAGDFMINGTKRIPASSFGPGFRAIPVLHRPRAVLFEGNSVKKSSFHQNSATWNEIAAEVRKWTKGAKIGFEFLIVMPDYQRMGIFYTANGERFEAGAKLIEAEEKKLCVKISTIIKGTKNQVKLTVEPIQVEANIWKPDADLFKAACDGFEAYKTEKAAPTQSGPPRR